MKSPINLKGGVLIKIVILDSHTLAGNDLPLTDFNQFGEVANYNRTEPDQVVQRIGDAEIVLSNKTRITNEMIDACPNLQYIGILATGDVYKRQDRCILQYHTTKNFICFFYVRFMNCEAKDCEQCLQNVNQRFISLILQFAP